MCIVPYQEKLFNQLLTERVCPLVVKLFSPSSKYRHSSPPPMAHSPTSAALLSLDKPTFGLSVRLLRILNVLIREFYFSLVRTHIHTLVQHLCIYTHTHTHTHITHAWLHNLARNMPYLLAP